MSYSVLRTVRTHCRRSTWILSGRSNSLFYSNGGQASDLSSSGGNRGMNVFDRKAKRWHKNRAAMAPDADTFDYLRDEVSKR